VEGEKIIIPFWVIYVNGGIGLLFGLITLVVGLVRGKAKLGIIGLIANFIAGFLLSLLGVLVTTGIFAYLIFRRNNSA
jgi:hypothetical protein